MNLRPATPDAPDAPDVLNALVGDVQVVVRDSSRVVHDALDDTNAGACSILGVGTRGGLVLVLVLFVVLVLTGWCECECTAAEREASWTGAMGFGVGVALDDVALGGASCDSAGMFVLRGVLVPET